MQPFYPGQAEETGNMWTGKKLSIVHLGPQSVDPRDEEKKKMPGKNPPCNKLITYICLYYYVAGKVSIPGERNLLAKQAEFAELLQTPAKSQTDFTFTAPDKKNTTS